MIFGEAALIEQIGTAVVVVITGLVIRFSHMREANKTRALLALQTATTVEHRAKTDARLSEVVIGQETIKKQNDMIHDLVNSKMQELKLHYMVALQTIFTLTGKDADKKLADDAAMVYDEHRVRQKNVDLAQLVGQQIARGELTEIELLRIMQELKTRKMEPAP